jgi:hypothetical protein
MAPGADPVPMGDPSRPIFNMTSNMEEVLRSKQELDSEQAEKKRLLSIEAEQLRKPISRRASRVQTPSIGPASEIYVSRG